MAQQPQHQYNFHYQNVELIKTESLGVGSYGAVCKAMCDDLPCAAKILHHALFQFTAPETTSVMQKFEQECFVMSAVTHPHIVQCLGTYRDPESRLLVLLMELMDESLTQFLKRTQEPLPYHIEVNLCYDISLALSYLHSNGIVHRDLSSNNVLLMAGSRAKVTDFGMAKLYDVNHSTAHLTPLTLCPGTVAYMSPEALGEPPVYTDKLDSFSLGVLGVQIMTRQFPDPGDRFKVVAIIDPRFPSGSVKVDIPEIERRQPHISQINLHHPLRPVALDCLKDKDRERPSCHELCGRISTLKASPMYTESLQRSRVRTEPAQSDQTNREREVQLSQKIQDLHQQLQGQQLENQQKQLQILGLRKLLTASNDKLQTQITTKDKQLASKDHQLQQKEATIATLQQEIQQVRQGVQSIEQVTAESSSAKPLGELQQQPRQRAGCRQRDDWRQEEEKASSTAASRGSMKLRCTWKDGGRAPRVMFGEAAAVNGSVAYFQPGGLWGHTVLAYDSATSNWSELPRCPNRYFSLAVVNNLVTVIGGRTPQDEYTSSLLSLTDENWRKLFPAMPTERCFTSIVCSGKSLVVAGGLGEGSKKLGTVEVMHMETRQWSTANSLPCPLYQATAILCGDQVHILGGFDLNSKWSKFVFTCSLATLLHFSKPRSLVGRMKKLFVASATVWHQLADTPVAYSAYALLHGRLLAVGGVDSDQEPTTVIHTYNTKTNSWEMFNHMATPRSQCLVAVFHHDQLMIVGGFATRGEETDSIEIATIYPEM